MIERTFRKRPRCLIVTFEAVSCGSERVAVALSRRAWPGWAAAIAGFLVFAAFGSAAVLLYTVLQGEQAARRAQSAAFATARARDALASLDDVALDLASFLGRAPAIDADRFVETVATVVQDAPAEPAIRGVALVVELQRPSPFALAPAGTGPRGAWPYGAADRASRMVFAWPPAAAPRIRGYDLRTDPAHRDAARRAIASGRPRASGFVVLTQDQDRETGGGPYDTLLVTPLRGPTTIELAGARLEPVRALVAIEVAVEPLFADVRAVGTAGDRRPRVAAAPARGADGVVVRRIVFIDPRTSAPATADRAAAIPVAGLDLEIPLGPPGDVARVPPLLAAAPVALTGVVAGCGVALFTARLQRARRFQAVDAERSRALYELATEAAGLGFWSVDSARAAIDLDARMARLADVGTDATTCAFDDFLARVHPEDRAALGELMTVGGEGGRAFRLEYRLRARDGDWRWLETFGRARRDPGDGRLRVLGLTSEVTRRRRAQDELQRMAMEDALTGLANRHRFQACLRPELAQGARVALILLDLDNFKDVNDIHGHPAGDALLREVAGRLSAGARPVDLVARLGGDEFALLLRDCPDRTTALEHACAMLATVAEPVRGDHWELHPTASAGVAFAPEDARDGDNLLRFADVALYRAKAVGPNVARLYSRTFGDELETRRRLEAKLRRDVLAERLEVHVQPVVDLASRATVGAEALLRWHAEGLGPVSPATFVPVAESCGLMPALERFVLREACRAAAGWPHRPDGGTRGVAVNVSSALWHSGGCFFEAVQAALGDSGLAPERLTLEVTETAVGRAEEDRLCVDVLGRLRRHGIRISIDDFGTGHSNLTRLRRLGFDEIKIDRQFVAGIERDPDDAAVVRAVVGLGRALGLDVVAEGIERADQARFLAGLGCRTAQGFYFARPMPLAEFTQVLQAEHLAVG
jgi:diguanylate cyclase (GGDEF)-like protein